MLNKLQTIHRLPLPFLVLIALKLGVCITCISRGWLTFRWDSPIRGLCWNEAALSPILQKAFNLPWNEYAQKSDPIISTGLETAGIILMITAILVWLPLGKIGLTLMLIPAILILGLDAVARWVESGFQFGAAIEKSLQWGIIWLLLLFLYLPGKNAWLWLGKCLAALTFTGHGLYAIGFHPVPWIYQSMTGEITGFEEAGIMWFLRIAGILDFVVAIAIFIPRLVKPALLYMMLWGGATALARTVAFSAQAMDPWLVETAVRTVHWWVPLLVLLVYKAPTNKTNLVS